MFEEAFSIMEDGVLGSPVFSGVTGQLTRNPGELDTTSITDDNNLAIKVQMCQAPVTGRQRCLTTKVTGAHL